MLNPHEACWWHLNQHSWSRVHEFLSGHFLSHSTVPATEPQSINDYLPLQYGRPLVPLSKLSYLHHFHSVCSCFLFSLLATSANWIILTSILCPGPWFVGEMVEGHLGACFVWGIIVYGRFLPGGLSYFYGMVFVSAVTFLPHMVLYVVKGVY